MSQQSPQQQQAHQQQQPPVPAMDPNAAPQPYMGPGPMGHVGAPGGPPLQQHGHHAAQVQAQAQAAAAAAAAGVTPVYGVPNATMNAQGQQQVQLQQQQAQLQQQLQQQMQQQGQGQYYGHTAQYHQAPSGYPPMTSMADYAAAHGGHMVAQPGLHPHAVLPPHMSPGGVQQGGHASGAGGHHAGGHHAGGTHTETTKKRRRFSQSEKDAVLKGVAKYGPGQWKAIKNSASAVAVLRQRTTVQIKDCYRTMLKRGDIPPDLGNEALKKLAQSKAEKLGTATTDAAGAAAAGGGGGGSAPPYDGANPPPPRRGKRKFTQEEKDAILNGVTTRGYGNWEDIRQHYLEILGSRSSLQIKDCYRTMVKLGQAVAIREDDDTKRERKRRFAARARDAKRRKKAAADAEYNNGAGDEEGTGAAGRQGGPPSTVHVPPPPAAAQPNDLPQEPVDGQVPQDAADADAEAYADAQEAVADAIDHAEEAAAAAAEAAAAEAVMDPKAPPAKVTQEEDEHQGGGDDADDDSTYFTEEEYYLWPNLWRRLERKGWAQVRAGRQHRTLDWLYVLPGCDGRTGTLGTDFFGSKQDVLEYVKSTDPYAEAVMDPKAPPAKVTQEEDEHQGGGDDADDDSTYFTEEEYYLWPNLWRRLERKGWAQVRAGRQHRTLDWLYVLPGCDGRTGTLGTDFFGSKQDVLEYVKSTDPYDAAKNKKSGGGRGGGDDGGGADSISF